MKPLSGFPDKKSSGILNVKTEVIILQLLKFNRYIPDRHIVTSAHLHFVTSANHQKCTACNVNLPFPYSIDGAGNLKALSIVKRKRSPFLFVLIFVRSISGAINHCLYRRISGRLKMILPLSSFPIFSVPPNNPSVPYPTATESQSGSRLFLKNGFRFTLAQ